ncbi:hypothetical protein I41_40160 [Lacipirellula limnantheis]|uniref:Uncharacterized protein n=2 Tax=Lacipirellula limnantheis TaxID=2528024 RepID=A0A517U2I4_9BACT|nr:hypothetical protein I41_40160 [Lacipirellula limnantheis]
MIQTSGDRVIIRVEPHGEGHHAIARMFAGGGKCRLLHGDRLTLIQIVELRTDSGAPEWHAVI